MQYGLHQKFSLTIFLLNIMFQSSKVLYDKEAIETKNHEKI